MKSIYLNSKESLVQRFFLHFRTSHKHFGMSVISFDIFLIYFENQKGT